MKQYYCTVLLIREADGIPVLNTMGVEANNEYEAIGLVVSESMKKYPDTLLKELQYIETE